jgi:hypothetical protein
VGLQRPLHGALEQMPWRWARYDARPAGLTMLTELQGEKGEWGKITNFPHTTYKTFISDSFVLSMSMNRIMPFTRTLVFIYCGMISPVSTLVEYFDHKILKHVLISCKFIRLTRYF